MTAPLRALPVLLAAAALAACGGGDGGDGGAPERPAQEVVASGDAARGKEVFAGNCAACHGEDGGGGTGPGLAANPSFTKPDVVVEQVREGGGGMPAFEGRLSEQEIADVSAYVVKDLAP